MGSDSRVRRGRAIVAGDAIGTALILRQGLSFAMGFDLATGRITDVHSRAQGEVLAGRVLVMPVGRGSSSASTSFAEAIRLDTAPAAIILEDVDEILAVGAIVARTLYGRTCPIVVAARSETASIATGATVHVNPDGTFEVGGSEVLKDGVEQER